MRVQVQQIRGTSVDARRLTADNQTTTRSTLEKT